MAPSSNSTKKLAKVARSGKTRSIRESSDRTYPLAIAAIVIVGSLLVFWGRAQRSSAQEVLPTLNDHWHAAYGVYLCDAFAPNPEDAGPDELGIHTHQDGIMHVHPFSSAAAGKKATLDKFWDMVGMEVSDTKIVTPQGQTYESGKTTCPSGEVGVVALVKWQSADDANAQPQVIRKDIGGARYENDRMAFTLAFVPEAKLAEVPKPESIPNLDNLSDVQTTGSTAATVPGATASTVAGDTTASTVAGATATTDGPASTTTAAGGSSTTASSTPASTTTTAG